MRGKVINSGIFIILNRITPAYAGKSARRIIRPTSPQDHPRLCGEKANLLGVTTDYLGSPPPMRGKGFNKQLKFSVKGITPAYAGKRV